MAYWPAEEPPRKALTEARVDHLIETYLVSRIRVAAVRRLAKHNIVR